MLIDDLIRKERQSNGSREDWFHFRWKAGNRNGWSEIGMGGIGNVGMLPKRMLLGQISSGIEIWILLTCLSQLIGGRRGM